MKSIMAESPIRSSNFRKPRHIPESGQNWTAAGLHLKFCGFDWCGWVDFRVLPESGV